MVQRHGWLIGAAAAGAALAGIGATGHAMTQQNTASVTAASAPPTTVAPSPSPSPSPIEGDEGGLNPLYARCANSFAMRSRL